MFSLSKILLPIDFSERCRNATRLAAPLMAKHFRSEVTLLHVLPPYFEFGAAELGMSLSENFMTEKRIQARRDLDLFLNAELRPLSVKRVLLEGDPAQRIVDFARSQHSDLIIMPTHGYGPFRRLVLGSVTAKVLHDADCPVWTGVHLAKEPQGEMTLEHILCSVDLGPHSATTLRWASRLASEFKARLTIVHVVASLDQRTVSYYFSPDWREYVMGEARADLEVLQHQVRTSAEVVLEIGDVAESVCLGAERLKADLLVVGRGSATSASNGYAIIRHAPCSVVSVRMVSCHTEDVGLLGGKHETAALTVNGRAIPESTTSTRDVRERFVPCPVSPETFLAHRSAVSRAG